MLLPPEFFAIRGFDIDNMAAQKAIDGSKALHAGRPRMAPTVSRSMSSLTSVMVKTSMMTLVPLPPMLFFTPRNGMMTTLWVTNFVWRGAGQLVSLHFLVEFDI